VVHLSRPFPRLGERRALGLVWSFDRSARPIGIGIILAMAAVLIGSATGLVRPPGASPAPPTAPVAQVVSYAVGWRGPEDDPLVTLPSGQRVKSSNYRGVRIGEETYYYNLAPHPSFDPLARGEVTIDQIKVVAVVGDAPNRILIYTLPTPTASPIPAAHRQPGGTAVGSSGLP